jgi:hypothetical protein
VILSSKKILHLEPGTHLLLVVQPPPSDGADGGAANAPEVEQQQ